MARQFKFSGNDIIKIDEAYLNDVLSRHNIKIDSNVLKSKANELYKLTGEELKHINVLRFKEGKSIVINNMDCIICYIDKDIAIANKINNVISKGKPNLNITLYPAFLKNDKMDFLVQKVVELGVTNIIPFFSKNTVVKLDEISRLKRREKLQKICIEATKQCGRTDEVNVGKFSDFKELLNEVTKHEFCIFAYENETLNLKEVVNKLKKDETKYTNICVIIGPEGGFDTKEVEELKKIDNVYTVSLGERILRAETASLNLISILMYEFD